MQHFLVVFDRPQGRVLREEAYDDERAALAERFRTEKLHRGNPDVEVVVLSAESREALRRTHARYFMTISELANAVRPAPRTIAQAADEV
jgi:hypothetical protein